MIRVGVYEWPVNEAFKEYRGLYRGNNTLSAQHAAPELFEEFFEIVEDGCSTDFSTTSFETLKRVWRILREFDHKADLLLFTDEQEFTAAVGSTVFIGYDVCAESAYYSPIGGGLHSRLLEEGLKSHLISEEDKAAFALNDCGLFPSLDTARVFSNICNSLQSEGVYEFESENGWRPVAIWMVVSETDESPF